MGYHQQEELYWNQNIQRMILDMANRNPNSPPVLNTRMTGRTSGIHDVLMPASDSSSDNGDAFNGEEGADGWIIINGRENNDWSYPEGYQPSPQAQDGFATVNPHSETVLTKVVREFERAGSPESVMNQQLSSGQTSMASSVMDNTMSRSLTIFGNSEWMNGMDVSSPLDGLEIEAAEEQIPNPTRMCECSCRPTMD